MTVVVAAAVTLERAPHMLPLGNLALDGAHSALHQVGPLTIPTPRLVPGVLPSNRVPLKLALFSFSFLHFLPHLCHPLSTPSLYCPFVSLSLALCPGLSGEEGCPACHSCPKPPSALLLRSVTAPSGLLAPACPRPAFPGHLATSAAACPLALGQPQFQLAADAGCSSR